MSGIPARKGAPVVGDYDAQRSHALLALPQEPTRTQAQREAAQRARREQERSAGVTVCDHALRRGDGRGQVVEDLRELGLLEDPLSFERTHFGKAAKEGAG